MHCNCNKQFNCVIPIIHLYNILMVMTLGIIVGKEFMD